MNTEQQQDVADQRRPGSATSCHGPDLEWKNCFRIPATGRRGVSSFTVRPTLGARMVKEEEEEQHSQCIQSVGTNVTIQHYQNAIVCTSASIVLVYLVSTERQKIADLL